MKKTIFAFALLTAALLAGCVKSDDTYKKLQPILPGLYIYSNAMSQNDLALLPANVGMRFAILLAEARKQGKPVGEVTDGKYLLQPVLFNASLEKVEEASEETGLEQGAYRLTFRPEERFTGSFCLSGQIVVKTGGSLLSATEAVSWEIIPQQNFMVNIPSTTGGVAQTLEFTEGSTRITSSGDGSYEVALRSIRVNFSESPACASDWSGSFLLRPNAPSLAYSDCHGKEFNVEGSFSGDTIFSLTMSDLPTRMSYSLSKGVYYSAGTAYTGLVTCRLTGFGDYPMTEYPSPTVEVEWTLTDGGQLSRVINYNGYTYSN